MSKEMVRWLKEKRKKDLYVMHSAGWFKVGISQSPKSRLKTLETELDQDIELVGSWQVDDAYELEQFIHNCLENTNTHGEWFRLTDGFSDIELLKDGVNNLVAVKQDSL
jgi:hypothetical protein